VQPAQNPFEATHPRGGFDDFALPGVENSEMLSNSELEVCQLLIVARRQAFNV
jgi:hypothetical protein